MHPWSAAAACHLAPEGLRVETLSAGYHPRFASASQSLPNLYIAPVWETNPLCSSPGDGWCLDNASSPLGTFSFKWHYEDLVECSASSSRLVPRSRISEISRWLEPQAPSSASATSSRSHSHQFWPATSSKATALLPAGKLPCQG